MKNLISILLLFVVTVTHGVDPLAFAPFIRSAPAAGGSPQCCVVEFDGTNGKIDGFSAATGASWSVSFWVYPISASDSYGTILTQGNTGGLWFNGSTRKLNFYVSGDQFNTTALPENTWSHVVLSVSAASGTYYVNGVSDGSFTGNQPVFSTMGDDPSSETFKGRLADMAVYSIALSQPQAAALYAKSTTPTVIGSLLAHWKLDDVPNGESGNGDTFVDSSGNGETGTGAGGLTGRTATF